MDKARVLIVDDSFVVRKIVTRCLRQPGLNIGEVVEAASGAEALVALRTGVFDLIVSDVGMPVMDGLEFLRELAAIPSAKNTAVVMLTSEATDPRIIESLAAVAKNCIRKPFTAEQMKTCISSVFLPRTSA